jgi:hypothetical protein
MFISAISASAGEEMAAIRKVRGIIVFSRKYNSLQYGNWDFNTSHLDMHYTAGIH